MELTIRRETVNIHNGLENLSILHISDIHVWFSSTILNKLEDEIININPDLIVMTGDFYDTPIGAKLIRKFIISVSSKFQIVFITGNHDHIYGSIVSDNLLNISNVTCIDNDTILYTSKSNFNYNFVSKSTIQNLNSNSSNILLIHNPEMIMESKLQNIKLVLAGHLHGGQFVLYKDKFGHSYPASFLYKYYIDRTQILDTTLIVSKGIGDTLPLRFNCPKELILITIK